ncbi:MAG: DNA repair protein RecN [Bradymonadales bacterium]|jgi:DNA repair protein RecN (Recombination protein N)
MLTTLSIKDFVIVSQLELNLNQALVVITGETGAGKSIIINALKLILGAKASADFVRRGAPEAVVEAVFCVDDDSPACTCIQALGLELDEGSFIVRRVIQSSGRSRIYINGSLQTLAVLRETMATVMDISGQHEHVGLLDAGRHLGILDRFAEIGGQLADYQALYKKYSDLKSEQERLQTQLSERAKRMDYLDFQIEELSKHAPKQGEEKELEEELQQLTHAESIQKVINASLQRLYDQDGDLLSEISLLLGDLKRAKAMLPQLTAIVDSLTQAQILMQDAVHELRGIAPMEYNPQKIDALHSRLQTIDKLKRKFARTADELPALLAQLREEREGLALTDERLRDIIKQRQSISEKLLILANSLHEKRLKSGELLGVKASEILQELAMQNASIHVNCEAGQGEEDLRADGFDRVEFFLAPNLGEAPKPLAKIASGGELSRVLLAFKRVLVNKDNVGVYVFDEVDAGIGGMTASFVANALKEVSLHKQVICITHLASIACYAEQHFQVSKSVVDDRTLSTIVELSAEQRVQEIARMLGGVHVSEKTLAHAADLLLQARKAASTARAQSGNSE